VSISSNISSFRATFGGGFVGVRINDLSDLKSSFVLAPKDINTLVLEISDAKFLKNWPPSRLQTTTSPNSGKLLPLGISSVCSYSLLSIIFSGSLFC
jgi:hypothetical protein